MTNTMTLLGTFLVTAYCSPCPICGTGQLTASGARPLPWRTVAAPKKFDFGEHLYIEGIGWRTVEDRGGKIKGNRLDIYCSSHSFAVKFGTRRLKVWK